MSTNMDAKELMKMVIAKSDELMKSLILSLVKTGGTDFAEFMVNDENNYKHIRAIISAAMLEGIELIGEKEICTKTINIIKEENAKTSVDALKKSVGLK